MITVFSRNGIQHFGFILSVQLFSGRFLFVFFSKTTFCLKKLSGYINFWMFIIWIPNLSDFFLRYNIQYRDTRALERITPATAAVPIRSARVRQPWQSVNAQVEGQYFGRRTATRTAVAVYRLRRVYVGGGGGGTAAGRGVASLPACSIFF